jgi:hypothetical protein
MPNPKDRTNKHQAPGQGEEVPVYYQPESGQPGTTRDPIPGAPEPGGSEKNPRRVLNDEKDDD